MTKSIEEKPVQIIINGRAAMTLMTSAEDPKDLVTGHIFTERVVETYADITSIHRDGSQVSVVTSKPFGILLSRKTVLAGCGGASSFLDSGRLGQLTAGFTPSKEEISRSFDQLPASLWYSGGLFAKDGTLLAAVEDVSSQNVLDRLIGHGLTLGTVFSETYVVLIGNLMTETVRKAIIAKIPFIAVSGDVTATAAKTAKEANLTLVHVNNR
ncbi:formate dehydrogenase accessory sulfurtransferase FdhD [Methanorbis furvi]|uniref:Sulfur carrier protein FdhD n=1 Tax=Methanorbis furvi TaxID=3028299 RepID=A0AAE4MAZ3_9EURY|nr:Sulfur carrier protein FdhD [Methanocorpusculaceae archaeon Ag1]